MRTRFSSHKSLLIASIFISLLVGLGLGYLIFKPTSATTLSPDTVHVHDHTETTWTCSMHPQIRQTEPGDCPICGMDLIPLADNTSSNPLVLEMTPEAVKLAQIETTVIGTEVSTAQVLSLSGKIQVDERLAASQVSHVPGRIEKLYVSFEGEYVGKGQKIAQIYSPELITAQQELLQALTLEDQNPGLLAAAKQKLANWKLTEAQIQTLVDRGRVQETLDIYADASGVVTVRKVAVGDYVKQGEVLFDLVNLNRVWVLFDAYEEDLAQIKVGDQIRFTTTSLPGQSFTTRVTFIDPMIQAETRVATVRGEVANTNRNLKPEMFVKGELQSLPKKGKQILVPKSAVLWTGKRSVVYVQVPDMEIPSFRYQEIILGERIGDHYWVKEGLSAGDEVVTQGSFSIDAAAQLNNQPSMMNQWVRQESGVEETHTHLKEDMSSISVQIPKERVQEILLKYFEVKDALVETNGKEARKAANRLVKLMEEVQEESLVAIRTSAVHIASLKDPKKQRVHFQKLSDHMYTLLKSTEANESPVYRQFCPMSFDNQGAYWLAEEKEVNNPYFGDLMLHCGSVEEEL